LRICFQNAVKKENISKYSTYTLAFASISINHVGRYPKLPEAIVTATNSGKQIKALKNFTSGWDLQRFTSLVRAIQNNPENECPLPHAKHIAAELEFWNGNRNEKAHEDHSGGQRREVDDDELSFRIQNARALLPRINRLNSKSREAKRINDKLNELQACLDEEDVHKIYNELFLTTGAY